MKYLFGVPYYKYNLKVSQSILDDIQHNYEIDSSRNSWDNKSYLHSETHHSNRDRGNPKFREINYSPMMSEYKKVSGLCLSKSNATAYAMLAHANALGSLQQTLCKYF